jgi:hypothetical protein
VTGPVCRGPRASGTAEVTAPGCATPDYDDHIERVVAGLPPLSEADKARIGCLLAQAAREDRAA